MTPKAVMTTSSSVFCTVFDWYTASQAGTAAGATATGAATRTRAGSIYKFALASFITTSSKSPSNFSFQTTLFHLYLKD